MDLFVLFAFWQIFSLVDGSQLAGVHTPPTIPEPGFDAMFHAEHAPKATAGNTKLTKEKCRTLFPTTDDLFKQAKTHYCPYQSEGSRNNFINPTKAECESHNWASRGAEIPNSGNPPAYRQCSAPQGGASSWKDVPAILGFSSPITNQCGGGPGEVPQDLTNELTARAVCCRRSGKYYNRLMIAPYTFCQNFKWTQCAAAGFLPGQKRGSKGGQIFLTQDGADQSSFMAGFLIEQGQDGKQVGITVNEVCLLDRVCRNRDEFWTAKNNAIFECDYDPNVLKKQHQAHEVEIAATWFGNVLDVIHEHQVFYISFCVFAIIITVYGSLSAKQIEDSMDQHLLPNF